MSKAEHHPSAFINVIYEEGTKDEAIKYLQETWNELCEARAALRELQSWAKQEPTGPRPAGVQEWVLRAIKQGLLE